MLEQNDIKHFADFAKFHVERDTPGRSIMKLTNYINFITQGIGVTPKECVDFSIAAYHKTKLNERFAPAPSSRPEIS